ncbi:hypothetical protein [Algoriphagus limi]|uniref:Uncharacterized protein n=1 Tax=Algoriphagus limi TaxID=2975273 RepID=A0ABT2G5K7_9BACT|nr:hypothetical protein [Algoriphagus limi]MCS5490539.1 hypothetical protein [Algoriphagus limi]
MNFPDEFKKPPLTLGDWIINLIISKIPLIGFIVLIVWAIDKSTEPNKANWAKSELIIRLIGLAIGIIIISIVGLSFFTHFSDQMDW